MSERMASISEPNRLFQVPTSKLDQSSIACMMRDKLRPKYLSVLGK